VAVPGGALTRVAVERAVRERGWRPAESPAEANLLVVAGAAEHDLEPYVARVWQLLPAPRTRVDVPAAQDVDDRLDTALRVLHDPEQQRDEARPVAHEAQHAPAEHHTGGHGGHGGHDMGDMDLPGGVPMADRAEDRDGLKLDQLHVPLGPVLPLWPAGLIVHTRLQGDVVQDATVEVLGGVGPVIDHPVARRLDSCSRLLAVAGWSDAAVAAQRFRDELLAGGDPPVARWARQVRRSRTLRWLLAGVGVVEDGPAALVGDALDRLHRRLLPTPELPTAHETQWTVDHLPTLLAGAELATARLIVASLDPDLTLVAGRG
jgi:hypothetical protein